MRRTAAAVAAPSQAVSEPDPELGSGRSGRFSALRHRDFALLWAGLLVSNTGTWMQTVAQGWLIITLTNSPGWLGAVALARSLPYLVVPPMGGVLADRLDRIRLLKVTQMLSLAIATLLAVLTIAHVVTVWHVLVLAFLSGAANSVDQPTRNALLPDLVPQRDLMNAISLNSVTFQGAALVGPAIAGLLVSVMGFGGVFLLNAVSFLAVVGALFLMRSVSNPQRLKTSLGHELTGRDAVRRQHPTCGQSPATHWPFQPLRTVLYNPAAGFREAGPPPGRAFARVHVLGARIGDDRRWFRPRLGG
jgi:MFS family permease